MYLNLLHVINGYLPVLVGRPIERSVSQAGCPGIQPNVTAPQPIGPGRPGTQQSGDDSSHEQPYISVYLGGRRPPRGQGQSG